MKVTEQLFNLITNHIGSTNERPKGFIMTRREFEKLKGEYNNIMARPWQIDQNTFNGIKIYRSEDAEQIIIF